MAVSEEELRKAVEAYKKRREYYRTRYKRQRELLRIARERGLI